MEIMMNTIKRWIVMSVMLASIHGFPLRAVEGGSFSYKHNCNMNGTPFQGTNYVQMLTDEDRRTIKRWDPENGTNAIPAIEAIQKARRVLEAKFPGQKWVFSSLNIDKWEITAVDTWKYDIRFYLGEKRVPHGEFMGFSVFVAPDGWIPELVSERDKSRK